MFTGIIQSVGTITRLQPAGKDARLKISTGKLDLSDTTIGDSIAVNGVCLTAVKLDNDGFEADVSAETLSRTSLGQLNAGSEVNLELAMRPDTRFGGHIVSGHVDGLGRILEISPVGESLSMHIEVSSELSCYVAEKGSITIDGVSLTVNNIENDVFTVNIVPHTQQETIISHYQKGGQVNIEVDIIARYLERLLLCRDNQSGRTADESTLMKKISNMLDD